MVLSFWERRFAFLLPFILHLSFIDFDFTVKSLSNKFSLRIIKLLQQIDFPVFPLFSSSHTQSRFNDKVARSWCLIFRKQLRTLFEIALRFFPLIRDVSFNIILNVFHSHYRYVITELLQSDLHKIIVSPQHLSADHIKVFLYQILRGLKYLHSARILHRDIKPGNLLVNSNCVLKICDFGLARVEEPDQSKHMTQEVVTQYYRAPEILMGARHYSAAVDVWSVGCIFGELLGRRILFQAQSPVQQVSKCKQLSLMRC